MIIYYRNKTCKIFFGILFISITICSCKKFVSLPLPDTQITAAAIFSDSTSLQAAVNGVYSNLASTASNAFTQPSLFADELISSSTAYGNDGAAQTNSYTPANDFGFFTTYYATIYQANAILAGIDSANASKAQIDQIKGECLFIRAFSYFELVNFYGATPLYTGTDVKTNALLPNSSPENVYLQIITDLNNAVQLLAEDYVVPAYSNPPAEIPQRTRANKQTANALLARVYLYTKDYPKAITASSAVISSTLYTLNPDVNAVFVSTSTETIFQLWNQNGYTVGAQGYIPYDPGNTFAFTVRPELVASFEPGDNRKDAWLQSGTGTQANYYYPYKWKQQSTTPGSLEYLILFRLAEIYLIRAEALAQTNDVNDGLADIYVIRERAGLMAPISAVTTSDQLLDAVASERRVELCFENGHRWFDLNRTGKTVSVLSPVKPAIDPHIELLPFPLSILKLNPHLKQNPGY